MFSCGRSCVTRSSRTQSITRLDPAFEPPLLFLYPAWYRKHLRRLHQAADAALEQTGTRPDLRPQSQESQQSSLQPGRRQAHEPQRTLSIEASQRNVSQQLSTSRPLRNRAASRAIPRSFGIFQYVPSQSTPLARVIDQRLSRKLENRGSQDRAEEQSEDAETEAQRYFSHNVRRTYETSYGNPSTAGRAAQEAIQRKRRAMRLRFSTDEKFWQKAFFLLKLYTKEIPPRLGETLKLNEDDVFHLTGGLDENIWRYNASTGCEIHLLPRLPSEAEGQRTVVLRGERRARELAREYLLASGRQKAASACVPEKSNVREPPLRSVSSQVNHHSRVRLFCRADQIPLPGEWSIRSFADHVEDLVLSRIPRTVMQRLYGITTTRNKNVAKCLEGLFKDPDLAPFLSTRALGYGLKFACTHTEQTATIGILTSAARIAGLSLSLENYDVLLESSLKLNDIESFESNLREMSMMQVAPQSSSWARLLKVCNNPKACRKILQYMKTKRLTDSQEAVEEIAIRSMSASAPAIASHDEGLQIFEASMSRVLGQRWASARVINRLLNECADRKLWHLAPAVIDMGIRQDTIIKPTTLTYLFKLMRKSNYLRECLDLLQSDMARIVGVDDSDVIPSVFMTAWNAGSYNVCRVLWHFAASHGIITHVMQNIVNTSLIRNVSRGKSKQIWTVAGKLIVGTDTSNDGFDVTFPLLNAKFGPLNPMQILSEWTPDDGTRDEQLSLAYLMLHRDLHAWKQYQPMERAYFFELLQIAFSEDYSWRIQNVPADISTARLVSCVIRIRLDPRSKPTQLSGIYSSTISRPLLFEAAEGGRIDAGGERVNDSPQAPTPKDPSTSSYRTDFLQQSRPLEDAKDPGGYLERVKPRTPRRVKALLI